MMKTKSWLLFYTRVSVQTSLQASMSNCSPSYCLPIHYSILYCRCWTGLPRPSVTVTRSMRLTSSTYPSPTGMYSFPLFFFVWTQRSPSLSELLYFWNSAYSTGITPLILIFVVWLQWQAGFVLRSSGVYTSCPMFVRMSGFESLRGASL